MADLPDSRLALTVEGRNGILKRWGPDELDGQDVPMSLRFGTAIPNGFKDLTSSLLRRIDLDYADMQLLGDVNVYGPGQEVVWQGRHTQFPRQHGDDFSITPSAVGWAAHLLDDPSFSEIYSDIDQSRWEGPSVQRTLSQLVTTDLTSPSNVPDPTTGQPSVQTALTGAWARTAIAEAWYNAHGTPIGQLYFAWKKGSTVLQTDANWSWKAFLSTDDNASSIDITADLKAIGPGNGDIVATTATKKFAGVQMLYTTNAGNANTLYPIFWTVLQVLGTHGLPQIGPTDATTPHHFYLSDIIENVVSRAAPLLNTADIETNTILIPHAVFEQVTASDAILTLNNYSGWDWGVYDNKRFFYRPTDPDRLTWTVRLSEGTGLELEGEQSDDIYNGVIVTFTDPGGTKRVYAPTGASADYTDSSLADTSADNPVNQAGIPRKWYRLDVPFTTTPAGALIIGQAKLAEISLPQRRGQVTVTGYAHHPTAGLRPAWAIRAGDYVRVEDHPADIPRRIIETSYSHQDRTNTLTVGNTAHKLDSIMELLQANLVALGG